MPTSFFPKRRVLIKTALTIFLFLWVASSRSQGLTGLWVGNLHNDSASIRKDQSFEIALTEYRGKVYGYSRSEFIVNDTLYYILKRVKGTIKGDVCEVEDDEIVAYNFRGKLDKGVKVTSTFRRNRNDSTWYLDGKWKTNATKKYYSVSGKMALEEEKDLMASKIFPHLEELNMAQSVAFYKEQKELNEYKPVLRLVKSERIRTEYRANPVLSEMNPVQDPAIREPNLARADIPIPSSPILANASSPTDTAASSVNARNAQPVAGLHQPSDTRPENPHSSVSPVPLVKTNNTVNPGTVVGSLPNEGTPVATIRKEPSSVSGSADIKITEPNDQTRGRQENPVVIVSPVVKDKENSSVPVSTVIDPLPNKIADIAKKDEEHKPLTKQENNISPRSVADVNDVKENKVARAGADKQPARGTTESPIAKPSNQVTGSVKPGNGSPVSNTTVAVNNKQTIVEKQPAVAADKPVVTQTNKTTVNKQTVPVAVNTEPVAANNTAVIGLADTKKQTGRLNESPVQSPQSITDIPVTRTPAINVMERSAVISGRKSEFSQEVQFVSDSLELALYDNGEIDGDTVSVYLNGEILMGHQGLRSSAIKKTISVPRDQASFTIVMFAESLGTRPPNTGLLVVHDGEDTYYVRFSSDFQKSTGIVFKRKNP